MKCEILHNNIAFEANLAEPIDISITIKNGDKNPNCYYAEPVVFSTIKVGDFVGSVAEGGSVNYQTIKLTPHGNGTHTEIYGHISANSEATVNHLIRQFHFIAELITLTPNKIGSDDVIEYEKFVEARKSTSEAVIIRTLPNNDDKKLRQYSGKNPPYLDAKIADYCYNNGIKHLLIDLPSLDKEVDGGALRAHRAFWGLPGKLRDDCSVTELIFVPNHIPDGLYLLNLQLLNIEIDASPSRPILYRLTELK